MFVADLATGAATRLTKNLNPAVDETMLVEAVVVRYPSFDGLEIPAILFKPKGASATNPVPAVVDVHGGPGGQNRRGYTAQYQHLVNHGYAVLRVNNRGSSGYGKTFYHMDDKKHGEVDLDDVVYGKKYLQTLDWVQKDKIAIMGGSYGGYMVAAALAFRPDEFNAGIDMFGVTNWSRTLESIPAWWGPSAPRCSTNSATRKPMASVASASRPTSTPTRSPSRCSSSRAPTTRACCNARATNWWPA